MKKITSEFDVDALIVDDYDINLELTKYMLEMMKCRVDGVASGKEALEKAAAKTYDIVFMDIQMPEMDGIETMEKIREDYDQYKKIPFVALTANAIEGDREKYLNAGMDDYISKPITAEKLADILIRQISKDKDAAIEILKDSTSTFNKQWSTYRQQK